MALPSGDVVWTNNSSSLSPSPDDTIMDRVQQVPFGHASEASYSGYALGNQTWQNDGGTYPQLDPLLPTGNNLDGGLEGDDLTAYVGENLGYRVATMRGVDRAESLPTVHKYVYDVASELGYPSGTPTTAAAYNCTVDPMWHIDWNRQPTYDYLAYLPTTAGETLASGVTDAIRFNGTAMLPNGIVGLTLVPSGALIPPLGYQDWGSGARRSMGAGHASANRFILTFDQAVEFRDGITVFTVSSFLGGTASSALNHAGTGNYSGIDTYSTGSTAYYGTGGLYYGSASFNVSGFAFSNNSSVFTQGLDDQGNPTLVIAAYRLNNTYDQATSTAVTNLAGVRFQAFHNGVLQYTSPDRGDTGTTYVNTTCHNTPNGMGAAYWPAGGITGPSIGYYASEQYFENITFNEALSSADMNAVFNYLGNKYGGQTITPINAASLYG